MLGNSRAAESSQIPSIVDRAMQDSGKLAELMQGGLSDRQAAGPPAVQLEAGSVQAEQIPLVAMPPARRQVPQVISGDVQLPHAVVGSSLPKMLPRMSISTPAMAPVALAMAPVAARMTPLAPVATRMAPLAATPVLGGVSSFPAAPESPQKAARRAAENEAIAERAIENSVHKAQDQERAAMFSAKKASALRAAAERAAAAESAAAQSEMLAADSFQNEAIRRANAQRTHAQASAVKAVVQKAAAYQATAEVQSAARRAAAARTAAEQARNSLQHDAEDRYPINGHTHGQGPFALGPMGHGMMTPQQMRRDMRRHADQQLDMMDEAEDEAVDAGRHRFNQYHQPMSGSSSQVYCNSFTCESPWSLRLHPETIQCGVGGCIREACCLGPPGAGLPPFGAVPGQVPVAAVPGIPPPMGMQPGGLPVGAVPGVPPPMGMHPGGLPIGPGGPPPAFMCHVGDAVTATWAGDSGQYRALIQSINPDGTISVSWQDGDTSSPIVAMAQVFKNGVSCAGMPGVQSGPMGPGGVVTQVSTSQGGVVTIVSDGTRQRPHCSWRRSCNWDQPTQTICARSLCQASGYSGGTYMSASNNMCTGSYTSNAFHYYEADTQRFLSSHGGEGYEAMITASCLPMAGGMAPGTPPVLPMGAAMPFSQVSFPPVA